MQLTHLGVDADEASLFQRLAGHVLYADRSTRPSSDAIRRGGGAPSVLWAQGISGDIPIVLVRIDDLDDIAIVGQLLRAHEYWRMKQLAVDLVILNERASSYVQDLQIALETTVRMSQSHPRVGVDGARGSVFVLRTPDRCRSGSDLKPRRPGRRTSRRHRCSCRNSSCIPD